jgi:hypothetical protein
MGEQVDYLRFMPDDPARTQSAGGIGVLVGGPGWVILGVLKMLGGALLAYLAIQHMVPVDRARGPEPDVPRAWEYVFPDQSGGRSPRRRCSWWSRS